MIKGSLARANDIVRNGPLGPGNREPLGGCGDADDGPRSARTTTAGVAARNMGEGGYPVSFDPP
jgi:hypothetical protein